MAGICGNVALKVVLPQKSMPLINGFNEILEYCNYQPMFTAIYGKMRENPVRAEYTEEYIFHILNTPLGRTSAFLRMFSELTSS